jgi:hypothetical protein
MRAVQIRYKYCIYVQYIADFSLGNYGGFNPQKEVIFMNQIGL